MALTDNLISYWKLDEASGNALDSHGSNNLTDTSTVGATTGKINGCRDFEVSASEYFSIADNASLSVGDIDFAVSGWVNIESSGAQRGIIGHWTVSGNRSWIFTYSSFLNRFLFLVSNDGTASVSVTANAFGAPALGTWCHFQAWHDSVANTINIQINNGAINSTSHSSGVFDSSGLFAIGSNLDGNLHFDGLIDEVGFWKRVLTSDERTALYNSGNGLEYPFVTAKGTTDTPAVSFTEAVAILAALSLADEPTQSIADSAAILATLAASDDPTAVLNDAMTLLAALSLTDSPTLTIEAASLCLVAFAVADTLSSAAADSSSVSVVSAGTGDKLLGVVTVAFALAGAIDALPLVGGEISIRPGSG